MKYLLKDVVNQLRRMRFNYASLPTAGVLFLQRSNAAICFHFAGEKTGIRSLFSGNDIFCIWQHGWKTVGVRCICEVWHLAGWKELLIFAGIMELTKKMKRLVAELSERKQRKRLGLFKAEGAKCVSDTLGHFMLRGLFGTEKWAETQRNLVADAGDLFCACRRGDLQEMSAMTMPPDVIAVYEQRSDSISYPELEGKLIIALDEVQDPGNLGTIIRTADWFGIRNLLCSTTTADVYNPKVVQATMGAIARVKVHYCNLAEVLERLRSRMPVYGTFLDGEPIYGASLTETGVIVMGNEGSGVSDEVAALIEQRLFIPSFCGEEGTSESLNVATATAITVSEFKRRTLLMKD